MHRGHAVFWHYTMLSFDFTVHHITSPVYYMNSIGLSTEPWGTLHFRFNGCHHQCHRPRIIDIGLLNMTWTGQEKSLQVQYGVKHVKKSTWLTVSTAALRSSKTSADISSSSVDLMMLFIKLSTVTSLLWWRMYADFFEGSSSSSSAWFINTTTHWTIN